MKNPKGVIELRNLNPAIEYTVLELGSGTGIAGIAFAKLFTKSTHYLTEYSESSLKLMKENILLNNLDPSKVITYPLEWGQTQAKKLKEELKIGKDYHKDIDIIIASDIVYLAKQFDDLL